MNLVAAPRLPWAPENTRSALSGALTVRLRERPEHVPTQAAVLLGRSAAALRVDDGPVDDVIRRFAPAHLVTHAYGSARHAGTPERAHRDWDGLEDEIGLSRTLRLRLDPHTPLLALLDALRALEAVELASADYLCETPFAVASEDPRPPHPAHGDLPAAWRRVGAARAMATEPGDSSLIVGIVDSGAALAHPELRGRLRPGADTVDLPAEHLSRSLQLFGDHAVRDNVPLDQQGHGTACAGIVGALGDRVPPGLAGAARILPMRALASARTAGRADPTAVGAVADIDAAVKLAVDLGARVLNLSFGTPQSALRDDDPIPHVEVVRYALARGCVLVAASGNAGDDVPYFPAALPGVIAVSAVDAEGRPCDFSSRGGHVALAAPGKDLPTLSIEGYRVSTGTSFAAPFVTAAAALLLALAARRAVALDPVDVRRLLVESAGPFNGDVPPGMGAGVLDVPAALARLVSELDLREVA
jgi:subtilisin family serine protease